MSIIKLNVVGEEKAQSQSIGVSASFVVESYRKSIDKVRSELKKSGIVLKTPNIIINDTPYKRRDFVSEGSLPYYYAQMVENRLLYHKNECGFYDYDKKAIVVDLYRIKNRMRGQMGSEFSEINGIGKNEIKKFVAFKIDEALRSSMASYLVDGTKLSKTTEKLVKDAIGKELLRSRRGVYGQDEVAEHLLNNIGQGFDVAAKYVIDLALFGKSIKEQLAKNPPDDYMHAQSKVCSNYKGNMSFLRNLYFNELKHEREGFAAKAREESLERTLSDYVDFSPYPYYLTANGIGVFFAAMLLEKKGEEAIKVVTKPDEFVGFIDHLKKIDFERYNFSDYYTPPLTSGGGIVYID